MLKARLAILAFLATGLGLGFVLDAGSGFSAAQPQLMAWNERGMQEVDADYGVYAMQAPGNNVRAQLVDAGGRLVNGQTAGVTLSYEGVADPSGSINTTSVGKTNLWSNVKLLFGKSLAPDIGLAGSGMPGAANVPQPMQFDPARRGWRVHGVPITPLDDAGHRNPYPLMRIKAKDSGGNVLATADVVLPVSDEARCASCHGSNTMGAARPDDGWVNDPNPERDYRLNVLKRHDDRHLGDSVYTAGLAASGYLAAGLYATVVIGEKPILCAACHASAEVEGVPGRADTSTLTRAMHFRHAGVNDPASGKSLNAMTDRAACYNCHAGVQTQHLRGAMGRSVALDGSLAIQCQSCHGPMRDVGNRDRKGWQDLPDCQSCHTGDAIHNAGELRYTTAFDASGKVRKAVDPIFATNANVPSAGLSLYSASKGHGNLQCAACHGTQHAEYPSGQGNDNLQPRQIQGHGGSIADCASCHPTAMNTVTGGPHTMHPVGNDWVRQHRSVADDGSIEGCRTCHGADDRGTVLSRMLGERRMQGGQQQTTYWQGFQIGCYNCHNGPRTEQRTGNRAAQVKDAALTTDVGKSVATDLVATDADGDKLTLRIVTQPDHGTVALADRHATYLPEPGWTGNTRFTFAAWDNSTDSNLGTVRIQVGDALPVPTDTAVLPPTRVPSPTVVPSRTPLPPSTPTPGTPAEPSPTGRPTVVPRPSSTPGVMVGRILLPIVRRGAR